MRIENRELHHLGGDRLDTKGTGTFRPASSVMAILDDGDLEITRVGGRPAELIHVTEPPPSGLKYNSQGGKADSRD